MFVLTINYVIKMFLNKIEKKNNYYTNNVVLL